MMPVTRGMLPHNIIMCVFAKDRAHCKECKGRGIKYFKNKSGERVCERKRERAPGGEKRLWERGEIE